MDPVMADSQEAKTCIVYDARLAANVDGQRYFLYADCWGKASRLGQMPRKTTEGRGVTDLRTMFGAAAAEHRPPHGRGLRAPLPPAPLLSGPHRPIVTRRLAIVRHCVSSLLPPNSLCEILHATHNLFSDTKLVTQAGPCGFAGSHG